MIFLKQNKTNPTKPQFFGKKHTVLDREIQHSKLDSVWGHTNQEISKEFNPDLDTKASSLML